jgi:fused signal recognition particle receptor
MFSFFKKKPPPPAPQIAAGARSIDSCRTPALRHPPKRLPDEPAATGDASRPIPTRQGWLNRLAQGLRKTGAGIAQVFTGTRIDDVRCTKNSSRPC